MSKETAPQNVTARILRLVGYLTDPKSGPGKLWMRFEGASTGVMTRLATSPRYLRFAGRGLKRMFHLHRDLVDLTEEVLHFWRVPTLGDLEEVRAQLRRAEDRLEITTTQLELALELLEKVQTELARSLRGAA
ncbi:hypothetical protein [Nannocystis radixulma]|uniref:Uncharacterized protein n=1 Tax=Nannocystis radixulma TaxID=2995305 RepID=A0ABT5BIK5_9BACT|nr:hypothetical protein [Nannocystis radixulma]MDC0673995.1 hypothetical protein [Nannocystis radixulma]